MTRSILLAAVFVAGLAASGRQAPDIKGPMDVLERGCPVPEILPCGSAPGHPRDLVFDSFLQRLYVTGASFPELVIVDATLHAVVAPIPIGMPSHGIAFDAGLRRAVVANIDHGVVTFVDVDTRSVAAIVAVGGSPKWVAIHPITHHAYVTVGGSNTVAVLDAAAPSLVAMIPVAGDPNELVVDPVSNSAYVTHDNSSDLSIIDTTTNSLRQTLTIDDPPWDINGRLPSIALDQVRHKAYVSLPDARRVVVVDALADTVLARIDVIKDGEAIGVNVNTNWVYLTQNGELLTIIDGGDHQVKAVIPHRSADLRAVEIDSLTGRIFHGERRSDAARLLDRRRAQRHRFRQCAHVSGSAVSGGFREVTRLSGLVR